MTDKKQKEPFFYIQQPKLQFPMANMQNVYSSKKAEVERKRELRESDGDSNSENTLNENMKKSANSGPGDLKEAISDQKAELNNQEKVQETIKEFEAKQRPQGPSSSLAFNTEKKSSFKRVKSFKEMNNHERLDYLYNFPQQLPPVPCIFETEKKAIRGFLTDKTDDFIEIKLFDNSIEKMSIHSLKEVRMVGLRK